MGSGCISSSNTGGFGASFKSIPDTGVKYTGPALSDLGICTGDTLAEVEAVILQKIIDFSEGKGITLTDIDLTQCACFTEKVGCCGKESCQTLECILQAYLDCMCELYADVQTLKTEVGAMYDGPYDVKCLSTVTSASKLPAIIQEMITELCLAEANISILQSQITSLTSTITTTVGNFLLTAIQSCNSQVVKTGTGASTQIRFKGFAPIGGIMPYAGSLAVFDASGLGITGTEACGWALCNGNNGTIDMKGLVPVGTTNMGGSPLTPVTSGALYSLGNTGGEIAHLLLSAESGTGAHSHPVTDPGHSHIISVNLDSASGSNNSNYMKFDTTSYTNTLDGVADVGNIHAKIRNNFTGISIGVGGGTNASAAHENRMPYRALYFIQRVS